MDVLQSVVLHGRLLVVEKSLSDNCPLIIDRRLVAIDGGQGQLMSCP